MHYFKITIITPRNANTQVNWLIASNMNWSNSISQVKSPNKSKTYKKQQCPIYTPFLFFQTLSAVRFDSHVTLTPRKSCLSGNKHYAVGNVAALKHRHLQATAFATALLLLVSLFCVASTIHVYFFYNQNNTFLPLTT